MTHHTTISLWTRRSRLGAYVEVPMRLGRLVLLVGVGLPSIGCGSNADDTHGIEPRLSVIEQRVFQPSCTFSSCHGPESPKAALNLTGSTHGQLVNRASSQAQGRVLVIPTDPDGSYLMEKLIDETPAAGSRMPYESSPLPEEKIAAVRRWIELGAPND